MIASIQKKSTDEQNISLRHVWFDILVDGDYLTSRDDVCDAMDIRDAINEGRAEPSEFQ